MQPTTFKILLAATLLVASVVAAQEPHDARDPATAPAAGGDEHDHEEHADEVKLSEAAIRQNGLRIGPATRRSLTASFVAPARVAFNSEAMAHVGSVVSGRLTDIKVRQGDQVKRGDVLLVVESPELGRAQSEFLQRRTAAEVAAAAVDPAKDAYDRAKKLFDESQGIALSEVQRREVEYRAAAGTKATSQAAAQAAENALHLLGFTQADVEHLAQTKEINPQFAIRAPIDGQVVEREVTLGELVSPEKERLLVIADLSHLWVLADVPEGRLADVGPGSEAEVQIASLPDEHVSGQVSLVSTEVDPATRAARVRIVVDNANGKLKPGIFARVVLSPASSSEAVLVVPDEAVQTVEGHPSVFVPVDGEPNTFARRKVAVGEAVNGYVPVLFGIDDGESVVVSGSFILKAELGKGAVHEH